MLLSVVIPIYQVEAYLEDCLARAALLPQEACELLLVDDCGTDGSTAIAERFVQAHAHARLIRRARNGGLSAARNTGLDAAQGDYVYFLDSDDEPVPEALLALTREAARDGLDVAKARFVFFDDETGEETPGPAIAETPCMSGGALLAAQCRAGVYEPMVWQCVYRRAFLTEHGLRMAEGLLFEDELFQAPALLAAERAAASGRVILRYRQRAGSIMTSFARSSRWCASYLEVCRRLDALGRTLPPGAAKRALQKRVGQIALSVLKNIPAYGLPPDIAREAMDFARAHIGELSGYALRSGDALVAAQGLLMRLSPGAFVRLYGGNRHDAGCNSDKTP
ncbi:MAG: glycosyltransferase [Clostridiales bacterium]|nr:glycosyltransferase [Clostridiales bacterium]MDY5513267.1 glycosyltransferase [Candidatus Ventricola sp.]